MRPTKHYARELLPIEAIASDSLRLAGGPLRAVLECPTLAFGIKGEAEQRENRVPQSSTWSPVLL